MLLHYRSSISIVAIELGLSGFITLPWLVTVLIVLDIHRQYYKLVFCAITQVTVYEMRQSYTCMVYKLVIYFTSYMYNEFAYGTCIPPGSVQALCTALQLIALSIFLERI